MPTGQTVPVHIPATISAVLPTGSSEHASGQQPQQLPKQQQPQPAKVAIRQNNTNSAPVTSTSTMALKQVLIFLPLLSFSVLILFYILS